MIPTNFNNLRVRAELSQSALLNNFRVLCDQVKGLQLLPMIKARAYGHDDVWTARTLSKEPRLYGFGVATLEEGERVRDGLRATANPHARVMVFSGATPLDESTIQQCERNALTPVISTLVDLKQFVRSGFFKRVPFEIKFNTGMNRMGIADGALAEVIDLLKPIPEPYLPKGVLSHLACGESPKNSLSRSQFKRFEKILGRFKEVFPMASINFHLGNSAGMWNSKDFKLQKFTQVARPGLSLYGVPPWKGAPKKGLEPVMTLKARILETRKLKRGESTGYGARFVAKKPTNIGILGIGYADGLHRALSCGGGWMFLKGKKQNIIGIVSMDLTAIEVGPKTSPGEWVDVLNSETDLWKLAERASTIPYEILTSVSQRVPRVYVD